MAKTSLHVVNHAYRLPGRLRICGHCERVVNSGEPYYWFRYPHGEKQYRCFRESCYPTEIDLESNEKKRYVMLAQKNFREALKSTSVSSAIWYLTLSFDFSKQARDAMNKSMEAMRGTNLQRSKMYGWFEDGCRNLEMWEFEAREKYRKIERVALESMTRPGWTGNVTPEIQKILLTIPEIPPVRFK